MRKVTSQLNKIFNTCTKVNQWVFFLIVTFATMLWGKTFAQDVENSLLTTFVVNHQIINEMRSQVASWEQQERYLQDWNLESSQIFTSDSDKQDYLKRQTLKYLGRRLEKFLPKTQRLIVADAQTREISAQRDLVTTADWRMKLLVQVTRIQLKFNSESLGINATARYDIKGGTVVASVNKKISNHVETQVSYRQPASERADTTMQINYSLAF